MLQGFKGPTYGASVALSTQMTLQSDSTSCIQGQQCLPLGGYSVWAAMPPFMPQQGTAAPEREQIVVMSHWDSRSLFRYMATVRLPLHAPPGAACDALAGVGAMPTLRCFWSTVGQTAISLAMPSAESRTAVLVLAYSFDQRTVESSGCESMP